jgi:hypothetical protein
MIVSPYSIPFDNDQVAADAGAQKQVVPPPPAAVPPAAVVPNPVAPIAPALPGPVPEIENTPTAVPDDAKPAEVSDGVPAIGTY